MQPDPLERSPSIGWSTHRVSLAIIGSSSSSPLMKDSISVDLFSRFFVYNLLRASSVMSWRSEVREGRVGSGGGGRAGMGVAEDRGVDDERYA
jgi:hypothetical protein